MLADFKYKKFNVTGGAYQFDLFNFFNQKNNSLPLNIAFKSYDINLMNNVKSTFSEQYDFTYSSGAYINKSTLYKENFSMFAPLWVEQNNLPEYFIILKLDGPVTINYKEEDNLDEIDKEINNPVNFFNNYIKNAKILKTFSLKTDTNIGKYINSYVNNELFPNNGSIYITPEKK